MQYIKIDPGTLKLEIDIREQNGSFAVVVCNGMAHLTELPSYSETKVIIRQGIVKRVKFNEGDEF
ncbi:XtrA/YqaO family protein [Bacillus sp. J33]|uniref:XtrA/YqaO family protein n=1 Tax=Bacillus sp. J33 TaxID=935836 RepID=UPI000A027DF7|nr:XtrA/YqaO family protein [Bacillus sp. J33]